MENIIWIPTKANEAPSLYDESLTSTLPSMVGRNRPRRRPKTRWDDSIKHDLHSAGLDTINAAHMVYDRPQWKAFVCGLPTLEPEHCQTGPNWRYLQFNWRYLQLHWRYLQIMSIFQISAIEWDIFAIQMGNKSGIVYVFFCIFGKNKVLALHW